jgi:ketosteroid isomerase-like protein
LNTTPCAEAPADTPKPSPAAIAERFYAAFAQGDAATMQACYHPRVHFTDPVFDLQGQEAGAMWRMLTSQAREFSLSYAISSSDDSSARVHWEARYRFSSTGRKVHNIIEAELQIRDGLIIRHQDSFDFWRWSRQALGLPGWLLGWSGGLHQKVQRQAATNLRRWRAKAEAR